MFAIAQAEYKTTRQDLQYAAGTTDLLPPSTEDHTATVSLQYYF